MSSQNRSTVLALTEEQGGTASTAAWVRDLFTLGVRAHRWHDRTRMKGSDRQLVLAVSVPARDYAAALIAAGWAMASPSPATDPVGTLSRLAVGSRVRAVFPGVDGTEVAAGTPGRTIVTGDFGGLYPPREDIVEAARQTGLHPNRLPVETLHRLGVKSLRQRTRTDLTIGEWRWLADRVLAVSELVEPGNATREQAPPAGSVARMVGLDQAWDAWLCAPPQDTAIVGTLAWLQEDLSAHLTRIPDAPTDADRLAMILRVEARFHASAQSSTGGPQRRARAQRMSTWSTRMYAAADLGERLPLPPDLKLVVLDGFGAIKYLSQIESPTVVCVLDRSVADETAAELVVQLRNTRGEPRSLAGDIGWKAPSGIEALAFEVAL